MKGGGGMCMGGGKLCIIGGMGWILASGGQERICRSGMQAWAWEGRGHNKIHRHIDKYTKSQCFKFFFGHVHTMMDEPPGHSILLFRTRKCTKTSTLLSCM